MSCPTPDKQTYRSKAHALRAQRERRAPSGCKKRLYPYECLDHWHMTHHTPERQARVFEGTGAGLTPVVNRFEDFEVRHVLADEALWVGKDVCRAVGISDHGHALPQLDEDERGWAVVQTLGGPQRMVAVTEAGVWSLLLISRSPKVKPFKRWLTHEVLPSIRKTGKYNADIALPDRKTMARWVIDAEERAELLQAKVAVLEPPAQAWNDMADASGDYGVGDAAKVLKRNLKIDTGERKLYNYLAGIKWVYREGGNWKPYQEQVNLGRLAEKLSAPFFNKRQQKMVNTTPSVRITPKGLEELHKRLGGQLAIAQ